jgi:hypothetical protein
MTNPLRTLHSPAPRHRVRSLLATIAGAALLLCAVSALDSRTALAQTDTASCSFLEIHATNDGTSIDPKLKRLKKKLERPPFSVWKKFALARKHDKKLTLTKTEKFPIGKTSKLSVEYKEYTRAKKERFKLRLTLHRKSGKKALGTDFTVDAGDYVVISISPTADMGYLLAVTCKK